MMMVAIHSTPWPIQVTRLVLVAACLFSAWEAISMARRDWALDRVRYLPHLLFLCFWSTMFGAGMWTLTAEDHPWWPLRWFEWALNLTNVSATLTVGGWAGLAWRYRRSEITALTDVDDQ